MHSVHTAALSYLHIASGVRVVIVKFRFYVPLVNSHLKVGYVPIC